MPEELEELVKVHVFEGEKKGESQQIEEPAWKDAVAEIIVPPYSPNIWAALPEKNTRLKSLVTCMAHNTVGRGFSIVPAIDPSLIKGEIEKEILRQTNLVKPLFDYPNKEMSFPRLMSRMKQDEESIGNGYLEISRNFLGMPDGIYHMPGQTVRKLKNGKGYAQIRNNKKAYFKNYGDPKIMDSRTGKYQDSEDIPFEYRANEVIHFLIYSSRSSYYGIPRYVAASAAITGNHLAAIRNVNFFDNDAVPRMAILISGAQLSDKAAESIKQFLQSKGKGSDNSSRVMVIEAVAKQTGLNKPNDVKLELKPLTVGVEEDASFQKYRIGNDEEIREAFRIGKVLLGTTEGVPKAASQSQKQITNEQVFYPEIRDIEFVLNQTIVRDLIVTQKRLSAFQLKDAFELQKDWDSCDTLQEKGRFIKELDHPLWDLIDGAIKDDEEIFTFEKKPLVKLRLDRPIALDPVDTAKADDVYASHGGLTPNDLKTKQGMQPYPATEEWADKPLSLTIAELKKSLDGNGSPDSGKIMRELRSLVESLEVDNEV